MKIKDLKETPDIGIGDHWDFKTFTSESPPPSFMVGIQEDDDF